MNTEWVSMAVRGLILVPILWLASYGFILIISPKLSEGFAIFMMKAIVAFTLIFSLILGADCILLGGKVAMFDWGHWFHVGTGYHFELQFRFGPVAGLFLIMESMLLATIVKYSENYLHKEPGFHRFFFLLSLFHVGFALVALAQTIDIMFMGWEAIGVTSVLLIAFYNKREHAVQNSFWAIACYRSCDVAFLAAAAIGHHAFAGADLDILNDSSLLATHQHEAIILASLIVIASLGKAAQFPFTPWITRAMEGPTPSSAIYYGALSLSLGPLLLIRFWELIHSHIIAWGGLTFVGAITIMFARWVSQTRSDAKSLLAYSAVIQMGFIMMEIGLGFKTLALIHVVANSSMRVFQFLRSLNVISDFYENPMFYRGAGKTHSAGAFRWFPVKIRKKLYYLALNQFGLEWFVLNKLARPWLKLFGSFNQLENELLKKPESAPQQMAKTALAPERSRT